MPTNTHDATLAMEVKRSWVVYSNMSGVPRVQDQERKACHCDTIVQRVSYQEEQLLHLEEQRIG